MNPIESFLLEKNILLHDEITSAIFITAENFFHGAS